MLCPSQVWGSGRLWSCPGSSFPTRNSSDNNYSNHYNVWNPCPGPGIGINTLQK
jgi:hypothetical protein